VEHKKTRNEEEEAYFVGKVRRFLDGMTAV
jgi:hypothetical protein